MLDISKGLLSNLDIKTQSFDIHNYKKDAEDKFKSYYGAKSQNHTESFEENVWSFSELTTNVTYHFKFELFIPVISFNNKIIKDEFLVALKCWTMNNLNSMSPISAYKNFSNLLSVMIFTKGLNSNLNELEEMIINSQVYTKDKEQKTNYSIKSVKAETAKRYIHSFISFSTFYNKLPIAPQVIETLAAAGKNLKITNSSRDLPKPLDVLNFKDCIETFYTEININNPSEKLNLINYFPIILWWDITSIIPMRPTEFCLIKRDCLSGNFLTFPRIKQRRKDNKSRKEIKYDTLKIPDEIIQKIQIYINLTEEYGDTDYLISFPAHLAVGIKRKKNVDYEDMYFVNSYLDKLLKKFYNEIIIKKYKMFPEKNIKPGDLRHIAIISMMLQGYDRAEIERLAGHFDINTQYSYINHMQYWIDTEIQTLSNQYKFQGMDNYISPFAIETLQNIQDRIKYNSDFIDEDNFEKLEIGFCKEESMPCPTFNWNYSGCYHCNHWRISLDELNEKRSIITQEISTIYNDLNRKVNYLGGLYNLHDLKEYGNFNSDIKTKINTTFQEIQHEKKLIAKLSHLLGVGYNE